MIKRHLLAPGPTPVPEEARLAMAASLIHHRGPEFKEIFADVRDHLGWAHQASGEVITLTCSGTGGFEAALATFTARGDKIISIGGGKFGERWGEMGRAFGLDVVEMPVEWGRAADPQALRELLRSEEGIAAVTMTANETSTGVIHDVKALGAVVKEESEALFLVDGVTAVGVHPMPMDEYDIDVLVSGSQKAFSVPPGLAFVAVSDSVWKHAARSDHGRYYFDLVAERDRQRDAQTAFTPAISIVLALQVVLHSMREEGLDAIWERHQLLADATRAGAQAVGLELFAERPSNATTAVRVPDSVSAPDVVRVLRERYGITIAGGQAQLKPFLIRFGHIGYFDRSDVFVSLAGAEAALHDLGADITPGAALTAAQKVFLK